MCLGALGLALLGRAALCLLLALARLLPLDFGLVLGAAVAGGIRRIALALGGGPAINLPRGVGWTGGRIGGDGHGAQENDSGQRPQP